MYETGVGEGGQVASAAGMVHSPLPSASPCSHVFTRRPSHVLQAHLLKSFRTPTGQPLVALLVPQKPPPPG